MRIAPNHTKTSSPITPSTLTSTSALISILISIFLSTSCANIVSPSGGPRDSLPPRLVKASPPPNALDVNNNKITLSFDEFVDIENIQENLIISPLPKTNPVVDHKLRNITIKLKDTLEPNTTYTLNFGKAIKDVNEGNKMEGFTYTFSTGKTIDSLQLSGRVILAETGKTDTTILVLLHRNPDDSAVAKERPRYLTRLNGRGEFNFQNLAPGQYYIYALKEVDGSRKYDQKSETFAFADAPVQVSGDSLSPVTLYAYAEENKPPPTPPAAQAGNRNNNRQLQFSTNLANFEQDLLRDLEISFQKPLRNFDSSRILLTDTLFKPLPGTTITKDSTGKKLTLKHKWIPENKYCIILQEKFAEDTSGNTYAKTDTFRIRTKSEKEYGQLRIRLRNYKPEKNPVLQLVQGADIVRTIIITSADMSFSLFPPGDYEIRILYDENKNGKWDPGAFFGQRRQPEKVTTPDKKWAVKDKSWENEWSIEL